MDLDLDDVLAELNELTEKDICDNGNITNKKMT
jgi:hypothetical protein